MKASQFFAAGVAASVISYAVGSMAGYLSQHLYDPASGLWRAMFTPAWTYSVLGAHVAMGFLLTTVYALSHTGLGKKSQTTRKGLRFGLLAWLLRDIPGALMTLVFMPVSFALVSSWAVSGLVSALLAGLAIAKLAK